MEKINMFLVKYAEIGTKGKNRYVFEEILCKRIRNRIKSLGEFDVRRDFGRIYVEAKSDFDYDTCLDYLTYDDVVKAGHTPMITNNHFADMTIEIGSGSGYLGGSDSAYKNNASEYKNKKFGRLLYEMAKLL